MKYKFLLSLLTFCAVAHVRAQKNVLQFDTSNCSSSGIRASAIKVIDQRADTTALLGFIQKGGFNTKRKLQTEQPLAKELTAFYTAINGQAGAGTKVMVQLYNFYAYEVTGAFSESAYFIYKADYFLTDTAGRYHLGARIDTVVKMSAFDVTNRMLRTIDESLCGFYSSMDTRFTDDGYTEEEVMLFDELEKKKIPCYAAETYADAAYLNWEQFRLQQPMQDHLVVKKKNSYQMTYKTPKGKTRTTVLYVCRIFACDNQLYYVGQGGGCYLMTKKKNDFYISSKHDLLGHEVQTGNIAAGAAIGACSELL